MNDKYSRIGIKMNKVLLRKEEIKPGLSKVIVSRLIKTIKRMKNRNAKMTTSRRITEVTVRERNGVIKKRLTRLKRLMLTEMIDDVRRYRYEGMRLRKKAGIIRNAKSISMIGNTNFTVCMGNTSVAMATDSSKKRMKYKGREAKRAVSVYRNEVTMSNLGKGIKSSRAVLAEGASSTASNSDMSESRQASNRSILFPKGMGTNRAEQLKIRAKGRQEGEFVQRQEGSKKPKGSRNVRIPNVKVTRPVSYTHLTLPTIYSV